MESERESNGDTNKVVPGQVQHGTDILLPLRTENPARYYPESIEHLEECDKGHHVGRQLDYSGVRVKHVCPFVFRDEEDGAARELDWMATMLNTRT